MAKVNMQEWYKANEEKLVELKSKFIAAMLEDENFFDFGEEDSAVYEHKLLHRGALTIELEPVDDLLAELSKVKFIMPDKPSEMDADNIERHKRHVFDDSRLDGFESKLKAVYSAFQSPTAFQFNDESLTDAIQTAFYDYQYDRDKEALESRIDEIAAQWAADGYMMAPGAMGSDIADAANDFDKDRAGKTENVFRELAQTVQENIQNSIEQGRAIEDLHMDFAIKYSELSKVFVQSAVDAYIAEIEKRMDEQRAQMSIIDSLTKSIGLDVKADITKHELELKERTARLAAYTQATNTYIDTQAGSIIEELRLAANIAEGYGGIFSSYGSLFTGISYEE